MFAKKRPVLQASSSANVLFYSITHSSMSVTVEFNFLPPSIICLSVWCYSLFKLLQSLPTTQHIYELSLNSSCPMFVTPYLFHRILKVEKRTLSHRTTSFVDWPEKGYYETGEDDIVNFFSTFKSDLFEATKNTNNFKRSYSIYSPKKFDILQLYIKFVLWTNNERKITTTPTQSL
jgi:hypothetical protein